MRNIFLRVIQSIDADYPFFKKDNLEDCNPDGKFLINQLKAKYTGFKNSLASDEREKNRPKDDQIASWCDDAIGQLLQVLQECGLTPFIGKEAMNVFAITQMDKFLPHAEEIESDVPNTNEEQNEEDAEADDDQDE
jgi:hypothetical protein